jgi:hypothetical protein
MNYIFSQGVKRRRGPEDTTSNAVSDTPSALPLLSVVVQSYLGICVLAKLCNEQGVALFSFCCLPPHVLRPLAGAPVYDMSLTHRERLRFMGCALTGKLVRQLSQGVSCSFLSYSEPLWNRRACYGRMWGIVRRVAAGLAAAERDKIAKKAEELCASGQCAAAVVQLQHAIALGHLPSRAHLAWLLIDGREDVDKDRNTAFTLVVEGASFGCHHCQGVMAYCYWYSYGCLKDAARSLELARESSKKGSRYGHHILGLFYRHGLEGVTKDFAQALVLYRLAAAQNLDAAQWSLGFMLHNGVEIAQDPAKALEWWRQAATQGHPNAVYHVFNKRSRV